MRLKGSVDAEMIERLAHQDHEDERSVTAKYVLVDLRDADLSGVNHRQIRHVAAFDLGAARTNPSMRLALLASDPTALECCEYYVAVCKRLKIKWQLAIFSEYEVAAQWCRDGL